MRMFQAMQAAVAATLIAGLTVGAFHLARANDLPLPGTMAESGSTVAMTPGAKIYRLRLYHLHTGESLDVVYRIGNAYIPGAIDELNHFLRDHRTQAVKSYDPKEFDLLHTIMAKLGKPEGVIDIVCGYRSPWSNAFLRGGTPASGVAEHSQHMEAKAIDIRIPGVPTAKLRDTALSLEAGGVGYYPVSQFVHVDVGPVRTWSFGVEPRRTRKMTRVAVDRRVSSHPVGE